MSTITAPGTEVEVRLRYRPVGDVLTVSVRSPADAGPVERTERGDLLVESTPMPDGSTLLHALQLLDAGAHRSRGDLDLVPAALRPAALDLLDPGRRHHGHPSTHRPTHATVVHEQTIRVPARALRIGATSAQGR